MRKSLLTLFSLVLLSTAVFAVSPAAFHDQLQAISDPQLRKTLENSIVAGLIASPEDFEAAVSRAESRANKQSPVFYSARNRGNFDEIIREIEEIARPIDSLDKDAINVEKFDGYKRTRRSRKNLLFQNLSEKVPASYEAAYELCKKFNPKSGTNDNRRLNDDIDAFLASIAKDPVIVHALKSTQTSMADLKKNWFGSGLGFEHVFAGELKGSKVSGYHWWYRFYRDERDDKADVIKAFSDIDDDAIFTGSFYWDPDGKEGPLRQARKPKGGFSNGHSVQALLAVGHIALETTKKHGSTPGAMKFYADINGETFTWQLYTMGGNIRSLYPMGKGKVKSGFNSEEQEEEFYNLEDFLAGEATLH
jgi:hypothetical protein